MMSNPRLASIAAFSLAAVCIVVAISTLNNAAQTVALLMGCISLVVGVLFATRARK